MKGLLAVIFLTLFVGWGGARIINDIQFDRHVGGYLKRAADANTVELAKQNLQVAIEYLEENRMTSGYTSIVYNTPNEDVGFWFTNLQSSLEELHAVKGATTQLEKTNVLMKLRETLLDNGASGSTSITAPAGISVFPNNVFYAFWGILSGLLSVVFIKLWTEEY